MPLFILTYNKDNIKQKDRERQIRDIDRIIANSARRRAIKLRAMPSWADKQKIGAIYTTARYYNELFTESAPWSVDHIVPVQGENVCGLHVEQNLRVIPLRENIVKKNRLTPDLVYHG